MNLELAEQVWNLLPHPSPLSVTRLFARKGTVTRGDFARNPLEIKRFADSCEGMSIYIAPNPTEKTIGIRHSAIDVSHWSWFFLDLDPICHCPPLIPDVEFIKCITCCGLADPSKALEELLRILGGYAGRDLFKNGPTIIDSGRGLQAWLRTDDKKLEDEGEFTPFEDICTRLAARKSMGYWLNKILKRSGLVYGCKLDTSCSDLPRVMRLPGTVNLKTGKPSAVLQEQSSPYPWLTPFLIAGTPKNVLVEPPPREHLGLTWQSAFGKLTRSAQQYLLHGHEEPGRHKMAFHTAKCLCELGVAREQAEKALLWANKLAGEDQELSHGEVQHCLETAFGKSS